MKKKRFKFNWTTFLLVIIASLVLFSICFSICCWVTYYNKPISEIPSWALWFMFGQGGR